MFERALVVVLKFEGGYVWDKNDPGGETNFGVTKKVAVENGYTGDMHAIPMSVVESIYRRRYWNPLLADEMPWPVALVTFDAAVNSGVSRASKWLQDALQVSQDGVIGQQTLRALEGEEPKDVAHEVCMLRLGFLKSLPTWAHFGNGWGKRVNALLSEVSKCP